MSANPKPPHPPMRVLGMFLVILAVALVGVGVLISGGSQDNAAAPAPATSAPALTTSPEATTPAPPSTTTPEPATTTPPPSTTPLATPASSQVGVQVLNNTTTRGLADRAAQQLRGAGWDVAKVGNYPGGIVPSTVVYFRPGTDEQAAATRLAGTLGASAQPRPSGFATFGDGLIVVLASDYDG
ncbi:LytR C-terminal domain-containing protein [Rhodococcus sp. X156]|uniref:LytR C-terminal domain-containing protein n=1 Tax=Rhodococcus sp. X156 TaxID=2499145 RepID=UPI000FD9F7F8|nr:LytR C-terminal domain-containing protein [Rhodococcus sp. X156]